MKLDIPYGYLYIYADKNKGLWPKSDGQRHPAAPLDIMVAERENLSPYNPQTKHHFENYFSGKGSDMVSILIYDHRECADLNQEQSIAPKIRAHFKPADYRGYYTNSPRFDAGIYLNNGTEKTSINIRQNPNGKYSAQLFSCKNGLYAHYYLDYEYSEQPPIDKVIEFKNKLNDLIANMIVA